MTNFAENFIHICGIQNKIYVSIKNSFVKAIIILLIYFGLFIPILLRIYHDFAVIFDETYSQDTSAVLYSI